MPKWCFGHLTNSLYLSTVQHAASYILNFRFYHVYKSRFHNAFFSKLDNFTQSLNLNALRKYCTILPVTTGNLQFDDWSLYINREVLTFETLRWLLDMCVLGIWPFYKYRTGVFARRFAYGAMVLMGSITIFINPWERPLNRVPKFNVFINQVLGEYWLNGQYFYFEIT